MLSFSVQSFIWKFLLICIHEQILIFKEILFSIYTSFSIYICDSFSEKLNSRDRKMKYLVHTG